MFVLKKVKDMNTQKKINKDIGMVLVHLIFKLVKLKIKNNFMFQDLIALNHVNDCYQFFNYFNFFLVVIYLFFTVLGLHSCTGSCLVAGSGGYSSCSTWASHCSEKRASLAAEHML